MLQQAIDTCNNPNDDTINGNIEACKVLKLQDDNASKACKAVPELTEVVDGKLAKLPGWVYALFYGEMLTNNTWLYQL